MLMTGKWLSVFISPRGARIIIIKKPMNFYDWNIKITLYTPGEVKRSFVGWEKKKANAE